MQGWFRLVQLLSMTVWVGGLVFFAFVLAPTAFQVLPIHDAGLVVGAALRVFDIVAMSWGLLFLVATYTLIRQKQRVCRFCYIQFLVASVMLLCTASIHWGILPAMEDDRLTAPHGDIALLQSNDRARIHFNALHMASEGVEGAVLALGLGVLFLLSR